MIHYFNPGHETAVLYKNPYYTLPRNMLKMQKELAFLPAWYAKKEELVLASIDNDFSEHLKNNLNFDINSINESELTNHSEEHICPWGLSLQAIQYFKDINENQELDLKIPEWKEQYYELNSRTTAQRCLKILIADFPQMDKSIVPQFFYNMESIENYVADNDSINLLAKSPYSSSGRGLLRLPLAKLNRTELQILQGMLNKQAKLSIEPLHNKVIDFAMEFMCTGENKVKFEGYSLFQTNEKGAYLGNILDSQSNIENLLIEHIDYEIIEKVKVKLIEILGSVFSPHYIGCIGVDMLIYEEKGEYRLQPCIEINMRYNMGYLAHKLYENYVIEGSKGKFLVDYNKEDGAVYHMHLKLQKSHKAIFENNRLKSGYLSLCPVSETNNYIAYILLD